MTALAWGVACLAALVAVSALLAARRARRASPHQPAPESLPRDGSGAAEAEAEARRTAVLEGLPMPVLVVDGRGRLADRNAAAMARFPFLHPGMSLLEGFGEHLLAGRVDAALRSLEPDRFEARLYLDGRHTFRVAVLPYAVNGLSEAVVVLTDASDAVAYQELRMQFVANVSHELKTPLTGLRGLLEALDDPEMDPATRARFVARCRREAERLGALISDILFLSELEARAADPGTEASDMCQAAAAEAEALAAAADEQGTTLVVVPPATQGLLVPLSDRLAHTVARNLVENAVRYAGRGATARISVTRDHDRVVLEVADDGVGIAERHLPHLFERFYRVDPSRSRNLGGTGLGLSIVKHIAESAGGEATATSREGFGTTVRVSLPAAVDAGAGTDAPEGARRLPDGEPQTVSR